MEHTENNEMKGLLTNIQCVILAVLKKWRVIVCTVLLVGMATDVVRTLTYTPQYSASTQIVVRTEQNTYNDLEGIQSYLKTLEYILNGQVAQGFVRESLHQQDVALHCRISSQSDTNAGNITMVSDSKQHAYYGLKALLEWYETTGKTFDTKYSLNFQNEIRFSGQPISLNQHSRNFILGAGISGILAVAFITVMELIRKSIRTPSDIERYLSCRLLASIPKEHKPRGKQFWKRNKQALLISSVKTGLAYRESVRKLRYKLESSAEKHGYKSILITSAGENEGKSSIVANLALSLGGNKHKVLLLDCDLLKPALHKIFEQSNEEKNLNTYLTSQDNTIDWRSQIVHLPKQNISVIMAQPAEHTEELLESPRLKQLLEEARKEFDYIIIDTPPAGAFSDAVQLNTLTDASLLVVRQDSSNCNIINETIARMSTASNNLIGCVYNARYAGLSPKKSNYSNQKYTYGRDR